MPIARYRPDDLPDGRSSPPDEISPYLDALREGDAVGDGIMYASQADARRAMARVKARVDYKAPRAGLARPGSRVWRSADDQWLWALVPSGERRARALDEAVTQRVILDRASKVKNAGNR